MNSPTPDTPVDPATADAAANADEFSIDEWLAGAKPPERAVTIYQDGAAYADFQVAREEYERLVAARARTTKDNDKPGKGKNPDASLGDEDTTTTDLEAVVARMRAAFDKCEQGRLTIRFAGLRTWDDYQSLTQEHKKEGETDTSVVYYHLAEACALAPMAGVPAEKWKRLRSRIGDGQWNRIVDTIDAACLSKDVTPDFSPELWSQTRTGES